MINIFTHLNVSLCYFIYFKSFITLFYDIFFVKIYYLLKISYYIASKYLKYLSILKIFAF